MKASDEFDVSQTLSPNASLVVANGANDSTLL